MLAKQVFKTTVTLFLGEKIVFLTEIVFNKEH